MSGFYEDERIRRKNVVHNAAYEEVQRLKGHGLTDSDIMGVCLDPTKDAVIRNEIYSTMLTLVGGSRGKNST
jgi:hypothetical protein